MRYCKLFFSFIFSLGCISTYSQADKPIKDSVAHEVSVGVPLLPILQLGSGNNHGLYFNLTLQWADPATPNFSVTYRLVKKERTKIRIGMIAANSLNDWGGAAYVLASAGKDIRLVRGKDIVNFNYNLTAGYVELGEWATGGMFVYPKYFNRANGVLAGASMGLSFRAKLSRRWFLESEMQFMISRMSGQIYYYCSSCSSKEGTRQEQTFDITVNKILGLNVGYRL